MKKFAVLLMLFALCLPISAFADTADGVINCDLPKTSDIQMTVDASNDEAQWKSAGKITLTKENTGTWSGMADEAHILPIDVYLLWGKDGIYVYANVTDIDPTFNGVSDCFEISFNPGGLIPKEDELQGMFFMFFPNEDGTVKCTRHNINRDTLSGIEAYDVESAYKQTETGWAIEAMIPWHYICDPERQVYVGKRSTRPLLRTFVAEEGAFLDVTLCCLNGDAETIYHAVYRTCTDNIGSNFNTDSYNVRLNLSKPLPLAPSKTETAEITSSETDNTNKNKDDSVSFLPFILIPAALVIAVIVVVILVLKRKK